MPLATLVRVVLSITKLLSIVKPLLRVFKMTQPQSNQRFRQDTEAPETIVVPEHNDVPESGFTPNPKMDLPPGVTWEQYQEMISLEAGSGERMIVPPVQQHDPGATANRLWDFNEETASLDEVANQVDLYRINEIVRDYINGPGKLETVIDHLAAALVLTQLREPQSGEKQWKEFTRKYRGLLTIGDK